MENYYKLLEKLKQITIVNYLDEINDLNVDLGELHEVMLKKLFNGDLDDAFESKYLDESNKNDVLYLTRKYKSLCLYDGDEELWHDSVDGVTIGDPDLVCVKLLSNYDFLSKIARDGGEDALKFLLKFKGSELALRSCVIDGLRNMYVDDDTLYNIVLEMAKQDSAYADFSDDEKVVLCMNPEGLLYRVNDDEVEMISVEEMKKSIKELIVGDDSSEAMKDILRGVSIDEFTDVIKNISSEYQRKYYEL